MLELRHASHYYSNNKIGTSSSAMYFQNIPYMSKFRAKSVVRNVNTLCAYYVNRNLTIAESDARIKAFGKMAPVAWIWQQDVNAETKLLTFTLMPVALRILFKSYSLLRLDLLLAVYFAISPTIISSEKQRIFVRTFWCLCTNAVRVF